MEGFSYYNMFETKGFEYLIIIAFLLLLIPFWLALNKRVLLKEQFRKSIGVLSASVLKIPQGIFYSKSHTWAYLEKSGMAKVGLDDLVLHITGEVGIRPLKTEGELIQKGELLAEMDQDGKLLKMYSPISGKVIHTNQALHTNRGILNNDPYGKGWLYTIKPSEWVKEISSFYLADEAVGWMNKELDRYKDFLSTNMAKYNPGQAIAILQDGGELVDNSLSAMPTELWNDFQTEFLTPKL